ncbi:MAG: hypothetical protein ACHQIG_04265 [Acidimicrobiia bacterium]
MSTTKPLGPLTHTVMEFLETMARLVTDADPPVSSDYWAPLEAFVAVDEFERLVPADGFPDDGSGTASDGGDWDRNVMTWPEYRDCFSPWVNSSPEYRNVITRIAEFPGLVYLEVEEHHVHGDRETIFNSLSTYEFNGPGKIARLRVEAAENWLVVPG